MCRFGRFLPDSKVSQPPVRLGHEPKMNSIDHNMSASTQTPVRTITLLIHYEFEGEMTSDEQKLSVSFIDDASAVVMSSSGMFDDYRLLFGDHIVASSLPDGKYELVGVQHPSPMRHFESSGGGSGPFPTEELHRIGGEWEMELMYWITHIPVAEFEGFCQQTGLVFPASTEIFSGISSILME